MRRAVVGLAFLSLLLAIPRAQASVGNIELSWNACAPIVSNVSGVAEGGSISMFVSVIGHDVPHKGYEFAMRYRDVATYASPDAWRFDPGGCQGTSGVRIDHLAPPEVAVACPSFQGDLEAQQIATLSLGGPLRPYGGILPQIYLSNMYAGSNTVQVDPRQRYLLGRIQFDHLNSVDGPTIPGQSCGGLATAMCFALLYGLYVTVDGVWLPLGVGTNPALTIGPAPPYDCDQASPIESATWGQIKSQYRN